MENDSEGCILFQNVYFFQSLKNCMALLFFFWWIYYPILIQRFANVRLLLNQLQLMQSQTRIFETVFFLKSWTYLERNCKVQVHTNRNQFKPELPPLHFPHCLRAVFSCSSLGKGGYHLRWHKHNDQCKGRAGYTRPGMEAEGRQGRLRSTTELFPRNQRVLAWLNTASVDWTHWQLSFLMIGLFKTSWCLLKEPEILKTLKEVLKVVFAKMIVNFFFLSITSSFICKSFIFNKERCNYGYLQAGVKCSSGRDV